MVHPFPSLLNAVAVLGMASIAGGTLPTAVRMAVSMALIQFAIGASNDLADAVRDGGRAPVKPIPAGLIRARSAAIAAGLFAIGGLVLAAPSGIETLLIALAGLSLGLVYNARFSRSALSWVPLTLALPLVPVFAWYGAVGSLPAAIATVLPIAMATGAGLAIGNGLVDLDLDAQRGRRTSAVALGPRRAWVVQVGALSASTLAVWVLLPVGGGVSPRWLLLAGSSAVVVGMIGLGTRSATCKRAGWALEAVGIVVIGLEWVLAVSDQAR